MLTQTRHFCLLPLCVCVCVHMCYLQPCLCVLSSVLSGVCSLSNIKVQWAWWCFSLSFVPILSWVLISSLTVAATFFFFLFFFIFLPLRYSLLTFLGSVFLKRSASAGSFGCCLASASACSLNWGGGRCYGPCEMKRNIRQMFFFVQVVVQIFFFPPPFSLTDVESSVQTLMSSQRQYFVDIIRLPVSLPALSGVVAAKQKNISGFNKGWNWMHSFFTSLFLHFFYFLAVVKSRLCIA